MPLVLLTNIVSEGQTDVPNDHANRGKPIHIQVHTRGGICLAFVPRGMGAKHLLFLLAACL